MSASRRKACSACIKGKRRCDCQYPACQRCVAKGIDCSYPSTRARVRAVPSGIELSPLELSNGNDVWADARGDSLHATEFLGLPSSISPRISDGGFPASPDAERDGAFFLSPDAWEIVHGLPQQAESHDGDVLKQSIREMRRWLQQWSVKGMTPFIHRRLYHDRLPRCIQDAYSTCAIYFSKNEQNEGITFRIIEDRMAQLLQEQQQHPIQWRPSVTATQAVFDHLARVQALLVYQVIQLFDGDIRQRHMAEQQIPTLAQWNREMWDFTVLSSEFFDVFNQYIGKSVHADSSIWRAWILAESARRTWLTVSIMQSVYQVLKLGLSECPGGIMFTARRTLWDAPSAFSWWKARQGHGPLFLQSMDSDSLFTEARADEVDVFAHFILNITFG